MGYFSWVRLLATTEVTVASLPVPAVVGTAKSGGKVLRILNCPFIWEGFFWGAPTGAPPLWPKSMEVQPQKPQIPGLPFFFYSLKASWFFRWLGWGLSFH